MEALMKHLDKVRIPTSNDRIYKDECVFSFDTPETDTGLYVCLNTFLGLGEEFVKLHHEKTGNSVFLHLRRIKHEKADLDGGDGEGKPKKLTKLGIGIEGGYMNEALKYDIEEINSVVVLPGFEKISLPNVDMPPNVAQSIAGVIAAESASRLEELQAAAGTWDGEKRRVSKFANTLVQLNNGVKIPPRGWKCERCDKKDNLWLNLTDGKILCGRKFFDGTGGNNHAVEYYQETKYPLAVKLGTITPTGADVYSYEEDDMVENPNLSKHLAHFGINISQMEKTEKSMLELELDYNERIGEWAVIQESDSALTPLYGPGFTGLVNLGNSCYLNSVIQVLFSVPDFQQRYYPSDSIFRQSPPDPTQDFNVQMAKLASGLLSGKYSLPLKNGENPSIDQVGIKPTMFKNLVGKGHQEFSSKRQQDVQEFFLHLINIIERNQVGGTKSPADCLKFQVEERIECTQSKKVRYTTRNEYHLPLPIPLERATNLKEVEEAETAGEDKKSKDVRIKVPLGACFDAFSTAEIIDDFYSTAVNGKATAKKTTRLKTFPDYLMLQLKKFTLDDNWVPKKLNVSIDVPDTVDLVELRGKGLQANEEVLPEHSSQDSQKEELNFDPTVVAQLAEMGFTANACQRALYNTQNSGVEAALNWLFEHQADADFNAPLNLNKKSRKESIIVDPNALENLKSMGLPEEHAVRGLKETNNNVERAIDWIFSHQEELISPMQVDSGAEAAGASSSQPSLRDGSEKYKLMAFISHMGTSTMCGHYVCHILKDGKWVIFNDNKVALSENPPKDLGYLYLYKRQV